MKSSDLIEYAKEKTKVDNKKLRCILSIKKSVLEKVILDERELTRKQSNKLLDFILSKNINTSIRPIVEFFEVEDAESRSGANWEILPKISDGDVKISQLRTILLKKRGVYLFYNSVGGVIYYGKTQKQSLWKEMNLAYNRRRSNQSIYLAEHGYKGDFIPASCKERSIKKTNVYLHDVAYYFSVYEVDTDLIHNLEAFLIRAIPNNLTNRRIEKFKYI